ncbi:MAG: restriction endonuclease subunit S [Candidatus Aminicenantes bacterium]|nr:restriction endonuclease subunit S [Candidatus Aminicenantes bacterium]
MSKVEGWASSPLGNLMVPKNDKAKQVKSTEYSTVGTYPIVDQSSDFICGYHEDSTKVINTNLPLTVFGDHTRHTKFVSFPFIAGADGTQLLKPKQEIEDKFFYYLVSQAAEKIGNFGYDRHFKHLREYVCDFPTNKHEQTKIAEILSTVDRAIEETETLIAKQQHIKTGLMHDLFTRGIDENGNLRSEQTHQFKDSPLGRIPVEWEVMNIRDVADYQNGKSFPSSAYRASGVRLVRPGNLAPNGWVVWDDKHTTYLPPSFWEKERDYHVGTGEILMNLTAQSLEDQFLGRVCMTPIGNACLLNQRIARIKPRSCDPNFLYWSFKGPHFRDYIDSITQGTKVQHIYNRNLDAVRLAVPKSLSEQKAVAYTLWGIENNTDATVKQLLKLRSLKTAFMQDLLTGKKRVTALLNDMEVSV